ncbi:metal-dependent transcriptional regulator [Halovenus rubra]|uniref:Metal-dependent transcriptional regulator n=2 Tax=Halovenus rubra TaxID=869890 RepID=A0ACC7DVA1_9EURY|nr:metal-dependent transcriptional regulator [Halovenus rubra]
MKETAQYLLALYIAEQRRSPPIPSGHLAEMLDRSPAATTEMLQRLESEKLVDREPYHGAMLTETGRERGEELHETYVALSWFFRTVLDLDSHEQEAMEMAGLMSQSVAQRLVTLLLDENEQPNPSVDTRQDNH